MKVEVKVAFAQYRIGQILDPSAMLAGEWLARGWVKRIPIEDRMKSEPEIATARQPETAARGRRATRGGRA